LAQQSFPPRPTWGVNDIPDLTGKVIIVTGASARRGPGNAVCAKHRIWSQAAMLASAKKPSKRS